MWQPARGFDARFALPVLLGPALNPINTTMISVALTPIADAVHVSASTVVWLVAGLYLVSAVAQPLMGKLSDAYGPKRVYLSGLVIVAVSGLLPTLLPTFAGVMIARLLIGLGTSAAYPAAMTLIRDQSQRYNLEAPQALLSGLSISSLVTAAIGPVLGGVLIEFFGWQSVFLVNIPLALIALAIAWAWLPGDSTRVAAGPRPLTLREAVDPLGIALFAVTITSLLVFLLDLSSGLYWVIPIGFAAAGCFVWWERRATNPFIDLRMIARNGPLARTFARLFLVYTAIFLVVYTASQWVQAEVGLAADAAGLIQLPAAVLAGIAAVVVARTRKVRLPLVVAAFAPLLGGVAITQLTSTSPLWLIVSALAVFGIPQALGSISNQAALYRQAPREQIGVASGLSRTAVQLGAILASGLVGVVFGAEPSDAGMHAVGWIVVSLTSAALVLTIFDRALEVGPGAQP